MGRAASGVIGMKLRKDDEVIELNVAEDDAELLVVTENGYGKRTRIDEYPVKGRGGLGVKTVQLTEEKGQLAGARVVRDGYQVMLISTGRWSSRPKSRTLSLRRFRPSSFRLRSHRIFPRNPRFTLPKLPIERYLVEGLESESNEGVVCLQARKLTC